MHPGKDDSIDLSIQEGSIYTLLYSTLLYSTLITLTQVSSIIFLNRFLDFFYLVEFRNNLTVKQVQDILQELAGAVLKI